jgi:hypothetical protein
MIATRSLDHICHQLGGNRCSTFVLFILPRVRKVGDNRRNLLCTRDFARMYHNAELHEGRIDPPAPRVDDIHIMIAHRLCDANAGFADPAAGNLRL